LPGEGLILNNHSVITAGIAKRAATPTHVTNIVIRQNLPEQALIPYKLQGILLNSPTTQNLVAA